MSTAKITLNHAALRRLDRAAIRALEKTTEAIHTDLVQAQTLPFKTGHMQNDQTFPDYSHAAQGHTEVVTSAPQGRRLYYHPEYNFTRDENPNAGAKWYAPYVSGGEKEDFAQAAFNKFFKREAGL